MDAKFEGWPHVIYAQQFSREWLENQLFPMARQMKSVVNMGGSDILKKKRQVSFFYQPSTRTRASFEIAMDFLGGRTVFSTENARDFSSAKKGETFSDTIKVLNRYKPDVIILRYDEEIGAGIAAEISNVPIINAGDRDPGQHPTQAILDIYTIQEKLGHVDGISIAMVGDLIEGRTARSLSYLLAKFTGVKIY
ncbi:MAG: aspartate carbamoyltransferase, partial [Candidatus Staskawiczbacteria bacterium]|nr:aspartate carbamoyltransferase [Candidatus Staskawiczbacteria bacterium]